MADLENKVEKLDERVSSLERQVGEITVNVNGLIRAMQDFKEEMRDRDNQRAEEIREMRQKHDADMKEIRSSIDSISKHIRNLTITSMAAIGGMTVAVGAMVATVIYSLLRN